MIKTDTTRTLPTDWTNQACQDLFDHARELGHNGNPAGFMLTVALHPFVGYTDENGNHLKPYAEWNYDGMRTWIGDHQNQVLHVWQFKVVSL